MLLDERRSLYDLLRFRASPSLKDLVERSVTALAGVESIGSFRLLSKLSSKALLSQLSRLLKTLRHPFDNSQLRVCIVDFLATALELGTCEHVIVIPEIFKGVALSIEEDYDIIVIHGMDSLPADVESYWADSLRSVSDKTGAVIIVLDALYHFYGAKWSGPDRGIVILKGTYESTKFT